jgi:hypothetical protein
MKMHHIVWLAVAASLPQLAVAEEHEHEHALSNRSLGVLEGTVAFCTEANPASSSKYHETAKRVVNGVQEKHLAERRDTEEYKSAYESVSAALGELSKEQVKTACAGLL